MLECVALHNSTEKSKGDIMNKTDVVLKKINNHLEKILKEDPNFTGNINISLCLGGLTGIEKKEKIKIK